MHYPRTMAPNHQHYMFNSSPLEPVSRTYQYRKIMKPMLERKRRARINKCLDELKDLMTGTLQADGENVSKLEKADILELTVRHLHRLREHNALFLRGGGSSGNNNPAMNMEKFWAGFQHCAVEVTQFLSKYDHNMSGDLVKHIASYIPNMAAAATAATAATATNLTAATNTANYQRFSAAMHQLLPTLPNSQMTATPPTAAAAAAAPTAALDGLTAAVQRRAESPKGTRRPAYASTGAAASKVRLHPYAKSMQLELDDRHLEVCVAKDEYDIEADDDEGDGEGEGGVWRPW